MNRDHAQEAARQARQAPVQPRADDVQKPQAPTNGRSWADRLLRNTGLLLCLGILLLLFLMPTSETVNTTPDAAAALQSGASTVLPLGTLLMSEDQTLLGQDVTITHQSSDAQTNIHIWDYASQDGDYVQVLVDGTPVCDPFMIRHEPVVLSVPTTGLVTVVGTHDGGGGITYAVHYDVNGTTYFNGMDPGKENIYTLIRE